MLDHIDFLGAVLDPNGPFVFCKPCRHVIAVDPHLESRVDPKNHPIDGSRTLVYRHLRAKHGAADHVAVAALVRARPDIVAALWNGRREYPRGRPDGSPWDDRLPLFQIYECYVCHDRRLSEDYMRRHVRAEHTPQEYSRRGYDLIWAQTWFGQVQGAMGLWWRVEPPPEPMPVAVVRPGARGRPALELLTERCVTSTRLTDDMNPFLHRTGWQETFARRPFWHAL